MPYSYVTAFSDRCTLTGLVCPSSLARLNLTRRDLIVDAWPLRSSDRFLCGRSVVLTVRFGWDMTVLFDRYALTGFVWPLFHGRFNLTAAL